MCVINNIYIWSVSLTNEFYHLSQIICRTYQCIIIVYDSQGSYELNRCLNKSIIVILDWSQTLFVTHLIFSYLATYIKQKRHLSRILGTIRDEFGLLVFDNIHIREEITLTYSNKKHLSLARLYLFYRHNEKKQ